MELISIHALREEGDSIRFCGASAKSRFLSTPSVRRATRPKVVFSHESFISIHALREEGDSVRSIFCCYNPDISIHALREEGDQSDVTQKQ